MRVNAFRPRFVSSLAVVLVSWPSLARAVPHDGLNLVPQLDAPVGLSCGEALAPPRPRTLGALRERNTNHLKALEARFPTPGFADIKREVQIEQVGEEGPRALMDMLGPNLSFIQTPAPTSPMDAAVYLLEERKSVGLHLDVPWKGKRTSTAVYASLPKTIKPRPYGYLVGAEYPIAVFHLHGGGTPTATGKNAMSIGHALEHLNIPVIGIDLPGHGRATRQINGFTTFEDQIDWVLKIADQLLDPHVKIVISGHSWGGEFAVQMMRHSHEPKYARIVSFVALSPPVDVSLGGDEKLKLDFERHFEEHFEEYEAQMAPADFLFHQNLVEAGKISDVGGYFTAFTSMGYKTPLLTPEEASSLKKMLFMVGSADAMVYVAREAFFAKVFANLPPGSRYIVMGPGMTWKGIQPTGHNVFDRKRDGTNTLEVYDELGNWVLSDAGPEGIAPDSADAAETRVDEFFRHYADFFLFREMVRDLYEYVVVPTADRPALDARKTQLEEFLTRVENSENQARKATEAQVLAALSDLRAELGLEKISVDRAREELDFPPLTDERRAELLAYLDQVEKVDKALQSQPDDSEYQQDMAQLRNDFGPTLESLGVSDLSQYYPKYSELIAEKGQLPLAKVKIRTAMSQLHQAYHEAGKRKQSRFGQRRDHALADLVRPVGVTDPKSAQRQLDADRSAGRRAKLESLMSRAPTVEASVRESAAARLTAQLNQLSRPEGVTTIDHARALKKDLDDMRAYVYVPSGNAEVERVVARIRDLTDQRAALHAGVDGHPSLERLDKTIKEAQQKRVSLVKTWEALWATGGLSSPKWREVNAEWKRRRDHYKQLHYEREHAKANWLLELVRAGQLDDAHILAGSPELNEQKVRLDQAKAEFEQLNGQLEDLKWQVALDHQLDSAPADVLQQASSIAHALWGSSRIHPEPESLMATLRAMENQAETLRRSDSVIQQSLDRLHWEYSQLMAKNGHALPMEVVRVSIPEAISLGYQSLLQRMRTDVATMEAFKAVLRTWNTYLAHLRAESQIHTKDTGTY